MNPEAIIDNFFNDLQNQEIDRVSKWVQEHEQKSKLRDQWRAWRMTQGISSLEDTKVKEIKLMKKKLDLKLANM